MEKSQRNFLTFVRPNGTVWLIVASIVIFSEIHCFAADPSANAQRPFGIQKRVPWTTSRIIGSPEPPSAYIAERVFPKLTFSNAVDLASVPGTDRLLLAELGGKIFSFRNTPDCDTRELLVDLKKEIPAMEQVYGFAFHPSFEQNGFIYICYVLKSDLPEGSRVSRFTIAKGEPPRLDAKSERILITWLSGGHNGGCLKFGPDNFLYISTGDAASPNPPDPLKTGQDNSDLLSSILRIDVDHSEEGKNYRVPPDNPFVNKPGIRPEIWAYGFRNPWRMSFDKKRGDLWAGDVGWELWEMVYRVERGGNYGWSIVEGPQSIHPDWPHGPTPILPPVKAHPHSEAASITGGCVYYGNRLKDLVGAYIYGDWVTGKIWALRSEGSKLTSLLELVDTPLQIICFGEDISGELFVVDYGGGIYQLKSNNAPPTHLKFPRLLSETGLFESVRYQIPEPGVIPFLINSEMWADNALAERFVGLPCNFTIQTGATNVWLYQSKNEWRYPTNAVLAKTLSLRDFSQREGVRRIETQILHYDGLDWHAYSYRWNEKQTDAMLVAAEGSEATIEVKDSQGPAGRKQTWRFHARAECLRCHNPWVNYALAFTAPQLNRDVLYQAEHPVSPSQPEQSKPAPWPNDVLIRDNQLRTFSHLGFFDQPLDERARPKFASLVPGSFETNINDRARSWLHVNCAHCHREGAGGAVVSHFDFDTKLPDMKAIGHVPSQGTFGLVGAHVITPGDPYSSALYYRIMTTGQGRMPHIGSKMVDVLGAKLIHDWIMQLPRGLSEDKKEDLAADKLRSENAEALGSNAAGNRDGQVALDRLLTSINGALAAVGKIKTNEKLPTAFEIDKLANHPSFQVRDLFERFLPEDKRVKKLGTNIKAEEILALKGDISRGQQIFSQEGSSQCQQCHRINGQGRDFGPDLSHIGSKYDRAQILDNILFPSKVIDPNFISYQLETKNDLSFSGFLVSKTANEIVLKDANLQLIRTAAADVKNFQPQQISAMPELLLQNMTAQGVADLIEYLTTLK